MRRDKKTGKNTSTPPRLRVRSHEAHGNAMTKNISTPPREVTQGANIRKHIRVSACDHNGRVGTQRDKDSHP